MAYLDRRYRETRFNGSVASNNGRRRSDGLVRQYLGRARQANHAAQSYGGSTGGASSYDPNQGVKTLIARSEEVSRDREIFKQAGSGQLGARKSLAEARDLPSLS